MQFRNSLLSRFCNTTIELILLLLAPVVLAQVTVDDIVQVSKKRIGRTTYEYTYQIIVSNSGDSLSAVTATVTSPNPNTLIVDGSVDVGNLAAGADKVKTSDTFSFRQNRRARFSLNSLNWTIHSSTETLPGLAGLSGLPEDNARENISNFSSNDVVTDLEIDENAEGVRLVRTVVQLEIGDSATVGQVNALLVSVNARIISMLEGGRYLTVRIPDPGSVENLGVLIANLESDVAIVSVEPQIMREPAVLPPSYSVSTSGTLTPAHLTQIDHHLAVGAHAAWNAQSLIGLNKPLVILYDQFPDGAPSLGNFNASVLDPTGYGCSPYADPVFNSHGYEVLSVISGRSDGNTTVPGIFPGTIDLEAVCINGVASAVADDRIVDIVRSNGGRNIILNTSMDNSCGAGFLNLTDVCAGPARSWIQRLSDAGIDDKFLHVSAAGNFGNSVSAVNSSDYNRAALDTALINPPNILVVENRVTTAPANPPVPGALAASSSKGGTISAIGQEVFAISSPTGASTNSKNGTSYSAPQVSGIAAFLWSIKPTLTVAEIKSILINTAVDITPDANIVDAYSAVLAIDENILAPAFAPVRLAILDVAPAGTGDGLFDSTDIEDYLSGLNGPGVPDYSRYDLNGDGFTGGNRTKRFNLNADFGVPPDVVPKYDVLTAQIDGNLVSFDEQALTDLEILCFYAYSSLFTGSSADATTAIDSFNSAHGTSFRCDPRPEIIVETGDSGGPGGGTFAFFDLRTSINNSGQVAFMGADATNQAGFIADGPGNLDQVTSLGSFSTRRFAGAGINNLADPEVAFQELVPGNPATYIIRKWKKSGPSTIVGKSGGGPGFCVGGSRAGLACLLWPDCPPLPPSPAFGFCQLPSGGNFDAGLPFLDISDSGVVAFTALGNLGVTDPTPELILMAGADENNIESLAVFPEDQTTYSFPNIRPQISNTNEVVYNDGAGAIKVVNADGNVAPEIVAGASPQDFYLSELPGISADGNLVVFHGLRSTDFGLFLADRSAGSPVLSLLADISGDPATAMGQFTEFSTTSRYAVASTSVPSGTRAVVIFKAMRDYTKSGDSSPTENVEGVFQLIAHVDPNGVAMVIMPPEPLIEIGDSLGTNKTVNRIELWDPLSDSGQFVTMWVSFAEGGSAILRWK